MAWHLNATFYELYVRAFADSNGDGHGDLAGLREKLDYLQWLGVDCIWLLPINPSPLKDDGYDVASYYGIHPDYGLLEDFQITLQEVHRRGMRLIIDLVLNHTSSDHPWFKEARRSKDSPFRDYYVWSATPEKYAGVPLIFPGVEESNWEFDEATGEYYWHRFYRWQPDLNYDNPKVQTAMLDAARFWLNLGVDGFRVDAVPYLVEREGTRCESLPETHAFIKRIRQMIDAEYPDAIMLAEACMPPEDLLPYYGQGDEFQLCFHFPVMPRLYLALAQGDRSSVVEVLNNTPSLPAGCQWATFLRNHDELNLWLVEPDEREYLWDVYAPQQEQRIFTGIRRRLAPLLDNDPRKIALMHSLLFTLPGTPVLYYGDEIGMGDDVSLPDRNGVRTPMQWNNSLNAGFSDSVSPYVPAIHDPVFGYEKVSVAAQQANPDALLHQVRAMIYARKQLPILGSGNIDWLTDLPKQALCFWRGEGAERILALHNLSAEPLTIALPEGVQFVDVFSNQSVAGTLTLGAYGYHWLKAQ